jgi:hypothetical protein
MYEPTAAARMQPILKEMIRLNVTAESDRFFLQNELLSKVL